MRKNIFGVVFFILHLPESKIRISIPKSSARISLLRLFTVKIKSIFSISLLINFNPFDLNVPLYVWSSVDDNTGCCICVRQTSCDILVIPL